MQNTSAKHPQVQVILGTVWVNDTRSITMKKDNSTNTVRDISINFDDPASGDRIFVKYTMWGKHVEEGDELKPKVNGKLCTIFTHDQIDWEHPRRDFADKQGRPCREYQISDASFHPTGSSSKEVDEVAEASTTAPQPATNQDNQLNPYADEDDL